MSALAQQLMNLLHEGWVVLLQDSQILIVFGVWVLFGVTIVLGILRRLMLPELSAADLAAFVSGAWMVPTVLVAAAGLGLALLSRTPIFLTVAVGLPASAAIWMGWKWLRAERRGPAVRPVMIVSLAAIGILMLLRLAFVTSLALPMYFDSPTHYGIVKQLVAMYQLPLSAAQLEVPFPGYYHLGYHVLLAAILGMTRLDLAQLMLVSGQVVLAASPFPLFFVVRRVTGSAAAAVLTVVLGALGWYMPAHVVNWGKYPALFSLPVILSVINLSLLAGSHGQPRGARRNLLFLAGIAAVAALFIHTRSVIVLLMVGIAWVLVGIWLKLRPLPRWAALALSGVMVGILFVRIVGDPLLVQVLDPYVSSGLWMTILTCALSIFALPAYRRPALTALLTVVMLLGGLSLPAPLAGAGTLLDRPLVEMLLFAPLAVLGGLGFAGLSALVQPRAGLVVQGAAALLCAVVVGHALVAYDFHPSTCCSLVQEDDLVALDWIQKNLPAQAQVGISSAPVRSAPEPYAALHAAADAGAWVTPFAGRRSRVLSYELDFMEAGTLAQLCELRLTDIYVGRSRGSFSVASLQARPEWYRAELSLSGADVYSIVGCGPQD